MKTNGMESAALRTWLGLDPAGVLAACRDGAVAVVETFEEVGDPDAAQRWREFGSTIETVALMAKALPSLMSTVGEGQ